MVERRDRKFLPALCVSQPENKQYKIKGLLFVFSCRFALASIAGLPKDFLLQACLWGSIAGLPLGLCNRLAFGVLMLFVHACSQSSCCKLAFWASVADTLGRFGYRLARRVLTVGALQVCLWDSFESPENQMQLVRF